MVGKSIIEEEGRSLANANVNFLPKFEINNTENEKRDEDLEIILTPLFNSNAIELEIDQYRTNIIAPHDLYPAIVYGITSDQQGIDPVDNKPVTLTIIGKVGVEKLPWNSLLLPGYEFHFSVPIENYNRAELYLSNAYNTDKLYSPLRIRSISHTEDRNINENTSIHTFTDGRINHKIILHIHNENQSLILPVDSKQKTPVVSTSENLNNQLIEKPYLGALLFETKEDFNIENFPLSENDTNDNKEKVLTDFIEKAASILRLDKFILQYRDKTIYANSMFDKTFRKVKCGPLVISLSQNAKDHNPGIEAFLSLVTTRLKFPYEITSLEAIAHNSDSKKLLSNHFEKNLGIVPEIIHNDKGTTYYLAYRTKRGDEIKLRMAKPSERKFGKGKLKWGIIVPDKDFENVFSMILASSNGSIYSEGDSQTGIKTYYPSDFGYYIEIKKYSDIIH